MTKRTHPFSGAEGFTLVELIVTMAVFMSVLIISSSAFNTIVTNASKLSKLEESNIEGMIGLEMMRHDLEQMGFGLPWSFGGTLDYEESTQSSSIMNDAPNGIPRPFVGYTNISSAVIGVKASSVGLSKTSQRWTYIPFENYSASLRQSRPVNLGETTPKSGDKVTALLTSFKSYSTASLRLSGGTFAFNYNANNGIHSDFLPKADQDTSFVYGITDKEPRMPFNRADFFVSSSAGTVPAFCAPGTKVLYKAAVNHNNDGTKPDGAYTYLPLLDCVASMQVVLGWSSNAGTETMQDSISTYSSLPAIGTGNVVAAAAGSATAIDATEITGWFNTKDAKRIREQLKLVKVYVLAQEGKRDQGYTYPSATIVIGGTGEASLTRTYTLSDEQRHYRWKLYRIIVKPKNLVSNQR